MWTSGMNSRVVHSARLVMRGRLIPISLDHVNREVLQKNGKRIKFPFGDYVFPDHTLDDTRRENSRGSPKLTDTSSLFCLRLSQYFITAKDRYKTHCFVLLRKSSTPLHYERFGFHYYETSTQDDPFQPLEGPEEEFTIV